MRYFHNDYNAMCHPAVLKKMQEAEKISMPGYGTDEICRKAAERVRQLCGDDGLAVHFLVGGTQANMTVIDGALRAHQGVLSADSGHINVHETGAVEATGHKVLTLPATEGKINAAQVAAYMENHLSDGDKEHTVQPKMVYISQSTEWGTVYSLQELTALSEVCKKYGLYLFADGARLGYALTATDSDVTLGDMARLTDVFYIGMTKCGALFGEAVVISNPALQEDFRYVIKQHGGMLAKGWLLGLQFEALFENDLYFEITRNANAQADILRSTLEKLGYKLYISGKTNQVFPILPAALLEEISDEVTFSPMEWVDPQHRVVRFCTSWATTEEDVKFLCQLFTKHTK